MRAAAPDPLKEHTALEAYRLRILYLASLGITALLLLCSQALIQRELYRQTADAHVVNLAGRQRMLSQRIGLMAERLAATHGGVPHPIATPAILAEARDSIHSVHEQLRSGSLADGKLLSPPSPTVRRMIANVEPPLRQVLAHADLLIAGHAPTAEQQAAFAHGLEQFLAAMEEVVFQYDREASARVRTMKHAELAILGLILIVLMIQAIALILPAVDRIGMTITQLRDAQESLRRQEEQLRQHRDNLQREVDERTAELREKSERLAAALEYEREEAARQAEFFALASHEFRSPLTAIRTAAESLEVYADRLTPEDRRRKVDRVRSKVDEMTRLLDTVLTAARAGHSKAPVAPTDVDLTKLLDALAFDLREAFPGSPPLDIGDSVTACRIPIQIESLSILLWNLIQNARKYSPPDEVVSLRLRSGPASFLIVVSDRGIGIPPGERSRILEPFVRGSNTGGAGGTGLGLAIVSLIVRRAGGHLTIDSIPGEGTTIRVELPTAPPQTGLSNDDDDPTG